MDWQLGVVGMVVLAAAGYLGRSAWRSWNASKKGCGGGCGCGKKVAAQERNGAAALIPSEEISLRGSESSRAE